jgi:hypothetical protein
MSLCFQHQKRTFFSPKSNISDSFEIIANMNLFPNVEAARLRPFCKLRLISVWSSRNREMWVEFECFFVLLAAATEVLLTFDFPKMFQGNPLKK